MCTTCEGQRYTDYCPDCKRAYHKDAMRGHRGSTQDGPGRPTNWQRHQHASATSAALIATLIPGGFPECNKSCVCWEVCHKLIADTTQPTPCELEDSEVGIAIAHDDNFRDLWLDRTHEDIRKEYEYWTPDDRKRKQ